jgi:tripartite-type tricarboxylate transporter receptor subunit TctC
LHQGKRKRYHVARNPRFVFNASPSRRGGSKEQVLRKRVLSLLACCALLAGAAHAQTHSTGSGQAYPSRPVRVLVGFAPGGPNDIIARAYAARLAEALGQPFVVENRPGATGNLAAEAVAKAAPDGHTLMLGSTGTNAVNPSLYPKLAFDLVKDLTPVTQVATGPSALAVHPRVSAQNVRELIALAKAQPGKLTYASAGSGSSQHLAAELFKQMAGVDIVHVPYKGAAPGIVDLLAGQVDMSFAPVANVVPHAKAGKLKLLGLTGTTLSAFAPDTPTISESGLPGFDVTTWYAVFAPAGTGADIVNRLHAELVKIAQSPQIREQLTNVGVEPATNASPAEARAYRAREVEKWGKLVRAIGVKVE